MKMTHILFVGSYDYYTDQPKMTFCSYKKISATPIKLRMEELLNSSEDVPFF